VGCATGAKCAPYSKTSAACLGLAAPAIRSGDCMSPCPRQIRYNPDAVLTRHPDNDAETNLPSARLFVGGRGITASLATIRNIFYAIHYRTSTASGGSTLRRSRPAVTFSHLPKVRSAKTEDHAPLLVGANRCCEGTTFQS
jgi:hypothetical protein